MESVPLFVNRVVQISSSISVRNVIWGVSLGTRMNVCVTSQYVRGLKERALYFNDDDVCDVDFMPVRGRDFNKRAAVSVLLDVFRCSRKEVESMVLKYPELKFVSSKNAQSNVHFFKEIGVPEEVLRQNPWLLKYRTAALSHKLDILKKMNLNDVIAVIPLLQFSVIKLRNCALLADKESADVPHGSRLIYTYEKLQCTLQDVCKEFVKHEFLFTVPFDRFAAIMDLLLGAGVSPNYIIRDMWVFRYSIENIAHRLEMAMQAGIETIKPWMLRSSNKVFSNTLWRASVRKQLLGENSVVEYLCQQLQCDIETVEYLGSKYPSLLRVHVSKLKEMFDFVYGEGFTPQHVCQVPRILLHSLETTKSRLMELRNVGYNPHSLIVLCKSKRQYTQFLEHVIKKKNQSCD